MEKRFLTGLVSYERVSQLQKMGQERRGEWLAWTNAVLQGVGHCQEPLEQLSKALTACWEEIAERAGMTNVSVTATNIGQKIVTESVELRERAGEEAT